MYFLKDNSKINSREKNNMSKIKRNPTFMSNSEILEELRVMVTFIKKDHQFRYHHLIDEIYSRLSYMTKK